jgi:predicted ABC-type transport system involved in lysophospholipase L1 biosynthesis ATPase subunit
MFYATTAENVEVALAPSPLSSSARREAVSSLLDTVGLGPRAGHLPSTLSGGGQQRVAMARARANEPTANLDSKTGGEIIDLLLSLSAEGRRTVVVVTHDDEIAIRAHRVVHMQDGALVGA